MDDPNFSTNSQFGLWRKWFWIGIVAAISNVAVGLIYGIALALEKDRRKEGILIAIFAVAWFIAATLWIGPWLQGKGILPHYIIT
ncbi:MAG: hypothetical protein WCS97_01120 [Candidatus Paceibacterota bacterium]|jgi:hypothetical protein